MKVGTGQRIDIIKRLVTGKHVLDLGCVDHKSERADTKPSWLHRYITKYAASVVGVDIEKEEIKKLKQKGYNVKHGNVEDLHLGQKFDVILAGELIEHLDNQGLFMQCMKEHMRKDSVLIITTPSPYQVYQLFTILFYDKSKIHRTHTSYHVPDTLRCLLNKYDMDMAELYWVDRPIKKRYFFVHIINAIWKNTHTGFLAVAKLRNSQ